MTQMQHIWLDLKTIFKDFNNYVIIKMSDIFPCYHVPSDVDVLCQNKLALARHILEYLDGLPIKRHTTKNHLQLDVYDGGKLHFKFDLIDNVAFSRDYGMDGNKVLGNKRKSWGFWIPQESDEIAIRLAEFKKYPSKIWHKQYIIDHGAERLLHNLESRVSI